MRIIHDFNTEHFSGKYAFFTVLSLITLRKVEKIERKKQELASKVHNLYVNHKLRQN